MLMYLIIGRTGSGKTYFANLLQNNGFKRVISRTTRPKRDSEDDDAYMFLTSKDAKKQSDRVAQTKIGDYEYFTLKNDLLDKDMYIIDPNGMYNLAKNTQDIDYHLIYVKADDQNREKHAIERVKNKKLAKSAYLKRNKAEDKQFSEFEDLLDLNPQDMYAKLPANIQSIQIIQNTYDAHNDLTKQAAILGSDRKIRHRLVKMLKRAVDIGAIKMLADGTLETHLIDKNGKPKIAGWIPEIYADYLLENDKAFAQFMRIMLAHDSKLDDYYPERIL